MKKTIWVTLILSAAFLIDFAYAATRYADLDSWFRRNLIPHVQEKLTSLPRFRHESIRFVVMQDDRPQSQGSKLAISLRDRLRDAMSDVRGIKVAWQGQQPGTGIISASSGLDCAKNDATYLVGIELESASSGHLKVSVRALDVEERSWIPGFSRSWQGPISAKQRRALQNMEADPTFRGERHAPWSDSETDLIAAHLAYELSCKLVRQTSGEYVLTDVATDSTAKPSNELLELVGNNLTSVPSLQFATDATTSNALIEGKAHRIDEDLYQYWVTITPIDSQSELSVLSADAYVRIPDRFTAARLIPEYAFDLRHSANGFLASFKVVQMRNPVLCASRQSRIVGTTNNKRYYGELAENCFALQVSSSDDAVVFFLNHQLNNGLVRLGDPSCSARNAARVAKTNKRLNFVLPGDSLHSAAWSAGQDWILNPGKDTFYALASSNTKAARALSAHVRKLPGRCSASVRRGLEGEPLRRWLEELEAIQTRWNSSIDWQSIHVKNVY